MTENYIDIDGYWGVLFCCCYKRSDKDRMRGIMESFGLDEYHVIEAMSVLSHRNTGMTISRGDVTMSVMFVSPATSHEQLMDTVAHEIDHVQYAICRHYDVERGSEDAAWLQGYLMRRITCILERKEECE